MILFSVYSAPFEPESVAALLQEDFFYQKSTFECFVKLIVELPIELKLIVRVPQN